MFGQREAEITDLYAKDAFLRAQRAAGLPKLAKARLIPVQPWGYRGAR